MKVANCIFDMFLNPVRNSMKKYVKTVMSVALEKPEHLLLYMIMAILTKMLYIMFFILVNIIWSLIGEWQA